MQGERKNYTVPFCRNPGSCHIWKGLVHSSASEVRKNTWRVKLWYLWDLRAHCDVTKPDFLAFFGFRMHFLKSGTSKKSQSRFFHWWCRFLSVKTVLPGNWVLSQKRKKSHVTSHNVHSHQLISLYRCDRQVYQICHSGQTPCSVTFWRREKVKAKLVSADAVLFFWTCFCIPNRLLHAVFVCLLSSYW